MLKFVKHHMESISGIEIYPIISLSIFFIFFLILGWWVLRAKKEHITYLSNLPLESTNNDEL